MAIAVDRDFATPCYSSAELSSCSLCGTFCPCFFALVAVYCNCIPSMLIKSRRFTCSSPEITKGRIFASWLTFTILSSGGRQDLSGGQRAVGLQRRLIFCYSSECFALRVLLLFDYWNFASKAILYNYVFIRWRRELSSFLSNQGKYETSIA